MASILGAANWQELRMMFVVSVIPFENFQRQVDKSRPILVLLSA